ncbi:DUF4781 domain-containing protein [Variovorax sp. W6]|uniref:DUF4781 domain-containing protein n=1 Tax=Variovorax sp. W6 TaxID=3093895 RepID=UPI003D808F64
MVAAAVSSSGASQAAIDQAAAARAAEEQRRAAEAEARRLAEEAARKAAEARRLAEEARKKAEEQRKAAEAAEAKAAQSKAEADQAEAQKARAQAKADELDALKKEAASNLGDKESTLAQSKLDDVRQSRAPKNPSEATRAAQSEVDAAKKTVALYEAPAAQPGAEQAPSGKATQDLLEKAQNAAKPVFGAQAAGGDGTPEQKAALNTSMNDWLESAQNDLRNAGLKAQAEGKDPNAAIDQEAARLNKAVDEGGVFEPQKMGEYVGKARDGVKAEAPAVRQLRAEQYDVGQAGKKQVADARTEARDAEAAATKAEARAASFGDGPGGNDTIITAKQDAKAEAQRLRGIANEADTRLDGLVKAFGTSDASDPTNPKKNVVGAVNADYNARAADAEVKDLSTRYDLAVAGGKPEKIKEAETALREAQDGQRYMHAVSDDAQAAVDASGAKIEYTDAESAWKAQSLQRPGTYTVTERDGDKQTTREVKAEGYDPAFWARPDTKEGEKVKPIDGKYFYVDGDRKTELDPVTARLWAAKDKKDAAGKNTAATASALDKLKEDLIGGADGKGPKVDAGRYVDNADAINQRLIDANDAVQKASPQDLGAALEKQRTAQAEFNALKAMQELRTAERDQAAGKPVDAQRLQQLRDTARDLQRKDDETKPRLSPDDEKKMRDVQLPQAQKDYDAKAAEVDKLNAPGSTATAAERQKAQKELDAIDLARRDYKSQLGLIDAERDWYAARNEYDRTTFAKPQLSMFMHDGKSTTGDIYPKNYDPTWNLKPGADGKVSAEGLPRGLSPDDIEVRFNPCGGGYTVHIKKNSEVVGWQKSQRNGDMRNFVVLEGDYKMNPATARLWATSENGDGALAKARAERGAVEKLIGERREEAPTAPDAKPVMGPDGKPVPDLRMGDDMTQRKKDVDKGVGDAGAALDKAQAAYDNATGDRTQLKNDLDDAKARVTIARNEQAAVDAVMLWQDAQRTRQLFESNERAGRMNMSYVKPPSEMESDARAKVVDLRDKWLSSRNTFYSDSTKRDLDAAQAAHDKWKSANPSLAETSSTTWNKLQDARGKVDVAQRYLAAGASQGALSREQDFIAQNLRPDQHDNGAELYKLFMRDPKLMAQSIINSHYVQYGGDFTQVQNRTHLENIVATGLGWKPDVELDPATPANNDRLQQTRSLFTHLGKDQKAVLDKTVDALVKQGGDKARVMVLPVVYGLEGDKGGIVKTAIFKVETGPGKSRLVDEQGWDYDDLSDYRANNNLPVQGVDLVTAEDGKFSLDQDGNVKLFSGDARTESTWEEVRRVGHLDVVAGVVGLVAGVVLTVGSMGTLSAPGAMLIAGSAAVLAAGYGVATSTESLIRQAEHGQDINPLTSAQARMDWMNLGLSAVSVPVIGVSTRATMQAMRARTALKEAMAAREAGDVSGAAKHLTDYKRYAQSSEVWGKPAAAAAKPLGVGSAVAFEEGARYLVDNWDRMTPAERNKQLGMLGLNVAGFASPVFARGYSRIHNAVKPMVNDLRSPQATAPAGRTTEASPAVMDTVQAPGTKRSTSVSDEAPPVVAADDPLQSFRESPAAQLPRAGEPLPDNVTLLHPDGAPPAPAETGDAAVAAVIPLVLRRSGGGAADAEPGAVPVSVRRPQETQRIRADADGNSAANAPFTRSPQRAAAERQRQGQGGTPWRIVHGKAEPIAADINPTGSDANCVNSAVTLDRVLSAPGVAMQAVPSGPKSWSQLLALYGDAPLTSHGSAADALGSLSNLADGSRGFVVMGASGAESHVVNFLRRGGRTELIDAQAGRQVERFEASDVKVMVTHEGGSSPVDRTVLSGPRLARFLAASPDEAPAHGPQELIAGTPAGGAKPGFDADGTPLAPTTHGAGRKWENVANHANGLVRRQQLAADPDSGVAPLQPSIDEAAVTSSLMADPAPGSSERFVVTRLGPRDTFYGNQAGMRAPNRRTFDNFADASTAAARDGGGWVQRVKPDPDKLPLGARRKVGASEIVGALHVDGEGQVMPVGIPNARDAATLAATTGVPTWKQGTKGLLSEQPKDALIRAKGMSLIAGGTRVVFEAIKPVVAFPAEWAGGKTAGYLSYPLSSFGRAAYLNASQRMKESMAAATRGDRATAEKLVNKVIAGSGWRGDKIMDSAKADSLRGKVDEVTTLGEKFAQAREAVPGGPSGKDFQLHTIRPTDDSALALAPSGYLKGVAGLRDFLGRQQADAAGEFHGQSRSKIRDELLVRIDRMSADELQRAADASHPDDSPQARLLREFPEVLAKFNDSVGQRAAMREAHDALYTKLIAMFKGEKGVDPQAAEGLGGSTNSPNTRIGLVSRRATIAVSMNTFAGVFFKPLNAGGSWKTDAGNFADSLSIGTLGANYIYNNKVDKLATIDLKISNGAKAQNKSVEEYLNENPDLKETQAATKKEKDKWNKHRDFAGVLSAARATAVGMGLMEAGPEVLAYGAFAQGGLTLAWVGLQQVPALRNGAAPRLTKALKWSAVGAIALVPAATALYKAIAGSDQKKSDSVVKMVWNGFTGLFEQKPGTPAPTVTPTPANTTTPSPGASASTSAKPSTTPSPTPSSSPSRNTPTSPPTSTPPSTPTTPPPTSGKPTPIFVTVDGGDPATATLWGMSEENQKTLLTPIQIGEAQREGGEIRVIDEALSQLFNLNPRFDRRLMDGVPSNVAGDPDTLLDGWRIQVGQRSA